MLGPILPFTAIVGQERLKLALQMLAIDPGLGGVLIRGEKGTAKSTAARGLAELLAPVSVNAGCPYGCPAARPAVWCDGCRAAAEHGVTLRRPPFVTLPLGITEDQLLGTMDLEQALRHGTQRFSPGLLARANQGVLYVDEVNLLDDHIVDLLLDVAATGVNVVAREGVHTSHPAEVMLVGTMNPEEGELRPQLVDRFGLCAEVESLDDPQDRAEIVMRRLAFEASPEAFCRQWQASQATIAERIGRARELRAEVAIERRWCVAAARMVLDLGADGHRADVLLVKGAAVLAALDGRRAIEAIDLERAAGVVMPHRLRRRPFDAAATGSRETADLEERARRSLEASLEEVAEKKNG